MEAWEILSITICILADLATAGVLRNRRHIFRDGKILTRWITKESRSSCERHDPSYNTLSALLWVERTSGSWTSPMPNPLRCIPTGNLPWIHVMNTIGVTFRTWFARTIDSDSENAFGEHKIGAMVPYCRGHKLMLAKTIFSRIMPSECRCIGIATAKPCSTDDTRVLFS